MAKTPAPARKAAAPKKPAKKAVNKKPTDRQLDREMGRVVKEAFDKVPKLKTQEKPAVKPATKTAKQQTTEPKKRGAPSKKTQELLDRICEGISTGKSARAMCLICNISQPTLWKWLAEDDAFAKQYARAKEECADFYAEQIIEISDEECTIVKHGDGDDEAEVEVVFDSAAVARNRLRVDARKWYASKVAPKKYGERTVLAGDKENPLAVLTMEQIAANPKSRLQVK